MIALWIAGGVARRAPASDHFAGRHHRRERFVTPGPELEACTRGRRRFGRIVATRRMAPRRRLGEAHATHTIPVDISYSDHRPGSAFRRILRINTWSVSAFLSVVLTEPLELCTT